MWGRYVVHSIATYASVGRVRRVVNKDEKCNTGENVERETQRHRDSGDDEHKSRRVADGEIDGAIIRVIIQAIIQEYERDGTVNKGMRGSAVMMIADEPALSICWKRIRPRNKVESAIKSGDCQSQYL